MLQPGQTLLHPASTFFISISSPFVFKKQFMEKTQSRVDQRNLPFSLSRNRT
jgi:hypothetical protein